MPAPINHTPGIMRRFALVFSPVWIRYSWRAILRALLHHADYRVEIVGEIAASNVAFDRRRDWLILPEDDYRHVYT